MKEGRVREILTFLVNDILKHEVILLGNAEEPRKKKVITFNHPVVYSKKIITCKNYFDNILVEVSDVHKFSD